jgi:ABC-2 type transport system ATP-binding protein
LNILEVNNVSKKYSNHQALNNVSIAVPKGSIYGLLGPNGAGKTSLIRIITQITGADSGEVVFNNEKLAPKHIARIGYLPEERGLYKKMKVGEQLLYLSQLKGLSKDEALLRLKYWFEKLSIQSWWSKNIEDLSKGMQQKVQFIATVLHKPELIILDEPFSGFDPINANLIRDEILQLRDEGSTIIFSTHRMETVEELCDHIALIHNSEAIMQGTTKSIKNQYKTNTYVIDGEGIIKDLPADFEIISVEYPSKNYFKACIRAPFDTSANRLISALIDDVEIHNISEKIPSINDIFIAKVTGEEVVTMPSRAQKAVQEVN